MNNEREQEDFLNEEALDVSVQFLEYFAESYEKDLGRKPTLADLCNVLKVALDLDGDMYFEELRDRVASSVAIETMPLDAFNDIKPGAVIEIYVPLINRYTYAMVVKGHAGRHRQASVYMQFYHLFTRNQLDKKIIRKYFFQSEPAFLVCVTRTGFIEGDWQVVDQQKPLIDEKVIDYTSFVFYEEGQYYVSEGDAYIPLEDMRKVSVREGRRCVNPAGKLDWSIIEKWLMGIYEGQKTSQLVRNMY